MSFSSLPDTCPLLGRLPSVSLGRDRREGLCICAHFLVAPPTRQFGRVADSRPRRLHTLVVVIPPPARPVWETAPVALLLRVTPSPSRCDPSSGRSLESGLPQHCGRAQREREREREKVYSQSSPAHSCMSCPSFRIQAWLSRLIPSTCLFETVDLVVSAALRVRSPDPMITFSSPFRPCTGNTARLFITYTTAQRVKPTRTGPGPSSCSTDTPDPPCQLDCRSTGPQKNSCGAHARMSIDAAVRT